MFQNNDLGQVGEFVARPSLLNNLHLILCISILNLTMAVLLATVQGCGVYLLGDIAQLAMAREVLPLPLCPSYLGSRLTTFDDPKCA